MNFSYGHNINVLFGERELSENDNSLYIDRLGYLYPSYTISDSSLINSNASLAEWYEENREQFLKIAGQYDCTFSVYSFANAEILNDSIIQVAIRRIDRGRVREKTSLTFLIHGFRKNFRSVHGDSDSPTDYSTIQKKIEEYGSTTSYCKVFWDGYYGCCFSSSVKRNKPLFELYEKAQESAVLVGGTLKKILSNVNAFDTMTIFSHSLGAKVAMYALLNIDGKNVQTPSSKKINICLVAPAISREMISKNYYRRNSLVPYQTTDNYHLFIVYNRKDFVLRKKDNQFGIFGPGPYKYGNTSLGCNHRNAATKLRKKFSTDFPGSTILLYDRTRVGKCHKVRCYYATDNMAEVIQKLIP